MVRRCSRFVNDVNFIPRKAYRNILTCFTFRTMFHKTLSSLILRKLFRKMLPSFNFMKVIPQNVMSFVFESCFIKCCLSLILRNLFGRSTTMGDCVTYLLCFHFPRKSRVFPKDIWKKYSVELCPDLLIFLFPRLI